MSGDPSNSPVSGDTALDAHGSSDRAASPLAGDHELDRAILQSMLPPGISCLSEEEQEAYIDNWLVTIRQREEFERAEAVRKKEMG